MPMPKAAREPHFVYNYLVLTNNLKLGMAIFSIMLGSFGLKAAGTIFVEPILVVAIGEYTDAGGDGI